MSNEPFDFTPAADDGVPIRRKTRKPERGVVRRFSSAAFGVVAAVVGVAMIGSAVGRVVGLVNESVKEPDSWSEDDLELRFMGRPMHDIVETFGIADDRVIDLRGSYGRLSYSRLPIRKGGKVVPSRVQFDGRGGVCTFVAVLH